MADQFDPAPNAGAACGALPDGGGVPGACGGEAVTAARGWGCAGVGGGAGAAMAVEPRAVELWNAEVACIVGPQRATGPKDFVSHMEILELLPGRHQWAPVAKKNTWIASQSVRKKRWAITMPRQRAAISLQIDATAEATANAAAVRPSPDPPNGAGPPGGPNECGTGGCGASDKSALRIAAASYLKNPEVEERSSEFKSHLWLSRKSDVGPLIAQAFRMEEPPVALVLAVTGPAV